MSTLVLGTLQEKPFYIHFTEEKTKTGVPYKWGELALNSRIQIHNGFPTLSINPSSTDWGPPLILWGQWNLKLNMCIMFARPCMFWPVDPASWKNSDIKESGPFTNPEHTFSLSSPKSYPSGRNSWVKPPLSSQTTEPSVLPTIWRGQYTWSWSTNCFVPPVSF